MQSSFGTYLSQQFIYLTGSALVPIDHDYWLAEIATQITANRHDAALSLIKLYAKKSPADSLAKARYQLQAAKCYLAQKNYSDAWTAIEAAPFGLDDNEREESFLVQAEVLYHLKRFPEALLIYDALMATGVDHIEFHLGRAQALCSQGGKENWQEALDEAACVLGEKPLFFTAIKIYAESLLGLNRLPEMIAFLEEKRASAPLEKKRGLQLYLARLVAQSGDFTTAMEYFKFADDNEIRNFDAMTTIQFARCLIPDNQAGRALNLVAPLQGKGLPQAFITYCHAASICGQPLTMEARQQLSRVVARLPVKEQGLARLLRCLSYDPRSSGKFCIEDFAAIRCDPFLKESPLYPKLQTQVLLSLEAWLAKEPPALVLLKHVADWGLPLNHSVRVLLAQAALRENDGNFSQYFSQCDQGANDRRFLQLQIDRAKQLADITLLGSLEKEKALQAIIKAQEMLMALKDEDLTMLADSLQCALTLDIPENHEKTMVIMPDGLLYQREAIEKVLKTSGVSPFNSELKMTMDKAIIPFGLFAAMRMLKERGYAQ